MEERLNVVKQPIQTWWNLMQKQNIKRKQRNVSSLNKIYKILLNKVMDLKDECSCKYNNIQ
jgi:hypothetical protein